MRWLLASFAVFLVGCGEDDPPPVYHPQQDAAVCSPLYDGCWMNGDCCSYADGFALCVRHPTTQVSACVPICATGADCSAEEVCVITTPGPEKVCLRP